MNDKMKHIHYYITQLFLWAGLFFISCSDEVSLSSEGKEVVIDQGNGFISINVSADAGDEENTDAGSDSERKVNAVRVVLYDATLPEEETVVKYAFDFHISSNPTQTGFVETERDEDDQPHLYVSKGKDRFVTYAREVEKQDYYMLVIINPNGYKPQIAVRASEEQERYDLRIITAVGESLSRFEEAIQIDGNAWLSHTRYGSIAATNHFIMTNHQGLIHVKAQDLGKTPDQANTNPIPVSVERMVAKIYVDKSAQFKVKPDGAQVSDFRWGLDCTNKKTYWMRKMTYIRSENGIASEMEKQGVGSRADFYAEDPNFAGYSSQSKENLWPEFYYLSSSPYLSHQLGEFQYTLENTMQADEQDEHVMTSVIVSCTYAPPGFELGTSYFRYNGVAISQEQILHYETANSSAIPPSLSGIKEDISKLEANGGSINNPPASFNSCNIEFFKDGINYYRIPIQHFDLPEEAGKKGYGRYGVVRNNLYNITINSLTGPGSIDGGAVSYYISANVTVLPWMKRTQSNDVGDPSHNPPSVNY